MMAAEAPYRPVNALGRGLALLDSLADLGWATPAQLAKQTGIDRSTVYRLLNTLVTEGYVVRRPGDATYFLGPKVRSIGFGIRSDDVESQIAQEELDKLVTEIGWPSDYACLLGGRMVILASTHRLTSMTFFRRVVGQNRSAARSALGRATLAAMSPRDLELTLEAVRGGDARAAAEIGDPAAFQRMLEEVRQRGYGFSDGLIEDNVSAIALPVMRAGHPIGAVNVVYFRSAMQIEAAATKLLPRLRSCVATIENRLIPTGGAPDSEGFP